MLGVRQLAVVSPARPEGEEQGQWDTGDSSMPDSNQQATYGYVRDLLARVENAVNRSEVQLRDNLRRLEDDEDERHKIHEVRSEKNEKLIELVAKDVSELKSDKRRATDAFYLLKWVLGILGTAIVFSFWLAYSIITGNNELVQIIQRGQLQRTIQADELKQELNQQTETLRQLKGEGPPK